MKIPFSPSVYEHAARLIGRTPWDVSRDLELLCRAHRTAYEQYHHSPIVVGVDIYNLEAEAYGGTVVEPGGDGIPAIVEPVVASVAEGRALPPFDPLSDGRIPMVLAAARRLAAELPEADVRVPVSGPFSIAVSLRGITGLLEDVALEPAATAAWLVQLAENQAALCQAIIDAGVDVAFFESAAAPPLLSPALFRAVELPALRRAMTIAADVAGHPVPCVIGGDTDPILDALLSTGTGYVICPAETDQAAFVARSASRPDVTVRINLEPHVVAHGTPDAILAEVDRIVALAATRPNCLLGTGALPYETPPGNVRLIRDYVA